MSSPVENLINERVAALRSEFASDTQMLKQEVHALREDMHRLTVSVGDMNANLGSIASALEKLADFPETWDRIKGFWSVMSWLRGNIINVGVFFMLVFILISGLTPFAEFYKVIGK